MSIPIPPGNRKFDNHYLKVSVYSSHACFLLLHIHYCFMF